jgi:transposase InsO family protein
MLLIDKQLLETPLSGVQQTTWHLRNEGFSVSMKRVRRLMRLMGLMPIYQKPNASKPAKGHKSYPYLYTWETGSQARTEIGRWITFYNRQRPHAAHGGRPPAVGYWNAIQPGQQVKKLA